MLEGNEALHDMQNNKRNLNRKELQKWNQL